MIDRGKSQLSKIHQRIFQILAQYPDGLTVGECWQLEFSNVDDKNKIAPRFNEMFRMGVLDKAEKRVCKQTGHVSTVWKVTKHSPIPIMYRNRLTEYHVVDVNREVIVQRAGTILSIEPQYRNNPKFEVWKSTSA